MYRPDPRNRPKLVTWSYRCWLVAGVGLLVLGVLGAVAGVVADGPTLAPISVGVIVAVVGGAYLALGSKAFTGDARWRSSLSALTLVVVAMLLFFAIGFQSFMFAVALLFALAGLLGSMLAYRPDSEEWFTGKPVEKQPAKKPGKR